MSELGGFTLLSREKMFSETELCVGCLSRSPPWPSEPGQDWWLGLEAGAPGNFPPFY